MTRRKSFTGTLVWEHDKKHAAFFLLKAELAEQLSPGTAVLGELDPDV